MGKVEDFEEWKRYYERVAVDPPVDPVKVYLDVLKKLVVAIENGEFRPDRLFLMMYHYNNKGELTYPFIAENITQKQIEAALPRIFKFLKKTGD